MYIKRFLEKQIIKASGQYPVVMVCGQRQVGKSTMLHHIMNKKRKYVTLDDFNAFRLATTDPALFFDTYGDCLLIDEFQRAPNLLLEIKRRVDEVSLNGKNNNGMYWLTGSQKVLMMKNVSESLAGRVAVFEMAGLSNAELEGRAQNKIDFSLDSLKARFKTSRPKKVADVYENIFRGSFPKLLTSNIDNQRYYMDYVNTYLERDIKSLEQVGKLTEFHNFLIYMASRTSQELKYDEIANAIGVSSPTAKQWVSILDRSGIIFILRPYFSNITNRLVKTPKVYFMDTGLASYLCRWSDAQTLMMGAMDGAFFETYVVTEIVKSYLNKGIEPPLYYYRDTDKKEIDLLIVEGNSITPVEIKKNKAPENADKNFGVLAKFKMNIQPGIIVCMSDELIPYKRDVWYCPVSVI